MKRTRKSDRAAPRLYRDRNIEATAITWGCTTGMIAICMPSISDSAISIILLLFIILRASISTISVWQNINSQTYDLLANLPKIEQRIGDLESICIREDN